MNTESCRRDENSGCIRVKVAIVGAGLSGLQCARSLLRSKNTACKLSKEDIIILEARDRIGGRIHTTQVQLPKVGTLDNDTKPRWFTYDEGAAFVHGTLPSGDTHAYQNTVNPVLALLESYSNRLVCCHGADCKSPSPSDLLREVFPKTRTNPWTKPNPATIALFADWDRGRQIPDATMESALRMWETKMSNMSKVGAAAYEFNEGLSLFDISVQQTLGILQWYQNWNDKRTLLERARMERIVEWYFHLSLEVWNALSLSQIPLSSYAGEDVRASDEEQAANDACDGDFPGPHCMVTDGMEQLVSALVCEDSLEECIRCCEEVEFIEWCNQGEARCGVGSTSRPTLRTDGSCGEKGGIILRPKTGLVVEANVCVVTIPLGCLKDSADKMFSPSLSREKLLAIDLMGTGSYKKVLLLFDTIFWPVEPPLVGLVRESTPQSEADGGHIDLGSSLLLHNVWATHGVAALEAVIVGRNAEKCVELPDKIIRDSILTFIEETLCNNAKKRCVGCKITRWEEDPFSRGAYSNQQVGSGHLHSDHLMQSEWGGALVFAGEATDAPCQGSCHGALLSGVRASEEIFRVAVSETWTCSRPHG